MKVYRMPAMGVCLILAACVAPGAAQKAAHDAPQQRSMPARLIDSLFSLRQMDEFVRQTSGLDVAARQNEVRRLQGKHDIGSGDRLKLAYLLSQENATLDDLAQAQSQLDGLESAFDDPATRLYVRQLQRTVAEETAHKQEKKRADELQDKLKQIKDLELDLMKRSQAKPGGSK